MFLDIAKCVYPSGVGVNRTRTIKVFCALGSNEAPSNLFNYLSWPVERGGKNCKVMLGEYYMFSRCVSKARPLPCSMFCSKGASDNQLQRRTYLFHTVKCSTVISCYQYLQSVSIQLLIYKVTQISTFNCIFFP